MNIEQIALEVRLSMMRDFNGLSRDIHLNVSNETEFLRRCLSKLAVQQDVEPVAYQHRDGMLSCRLPGGPVAGIDWTPLYTEAQLIAAQQRTAEACANVCEAERSEDGDGQHPAWYAGFDACADAIRNGAWREYL